MGTIGDVVINLYEKYVSPSKKVATKESRITSVDEYSAALQKDDYSRLSPQRRRDIANMSPLLMKGIRKKSLDSVRAWLEIETLNGRGKPVNADINAIRAFELRTNYRKKLYDAAVCAHIYGDGFLLISFSNDKGLSVSDAPRPNAEPIGVSVLNPEQITEVAYKNKENQNKDLYHYVLKKASDNSTALIHPDRIQHVMIDSLPYSKLGLSKIDLLRHTIESKKNIDIATGNILAWFSHGIIDLKWEGMSPDEKKEMLKIAATHPSAWVHDEDLEVDIKNPQAIDPKPFYDYVILNIAAALVMPTHILTGVQTGRVTGSEIGYGDYYRDVHDMQELIYQPLIEDLYRRIIEARGREWKYKINFNTIYVDEKSEADIMKERVESAEKALNGTKGIGGFIDKEEARRIFNDGQIELEAEKKITFKPPLPKPDVPEKPENPHNPPKPPEMPEKKKVEKKLTELDSEQKAMIARWKAYRKKELDEYEKRTSENNDEN